MPYELEHEVLAVGFSFALVHIRGRFVRTRTPVPFEQWSDELHPGMPLLRFLVSNNSADARDGKVIIPHDIVASLAPAETQAAGLPEACPYALRLEAGGAFSDENFSIRTTWLDMAGNQVVGLGRTGAAITSVSERFLIREPLFTVLEEVDQLNKLGHAPDRSALDARMVQIARLRAALEAATGAASSDNYFERITISHATGIAIAAIDSDADPRFSPELFGNVPPSPGSSENEEIDLDRQPLLPVDQAQLFSDSLFPGQGAWSHYRLGEGTYVVLDAPVVAALKVIQRVNQSDTETRRLFRRDPQSFLIPEIEAAGGRGDILCGGSALIQDEMAEYGRRVLGVVEWNGKSFSFKIPVHQNWFPEEEGGEVFPITLSGCDDTILIRKSEVEQLIDTVQAAEAAGSHVFTHNGRTYPLNSAADLVSTLSALSGSISPDASGKADSEHEKRSKRLVLRVAENEEDLTYHARLRDPEGTLAKQQSADIPGLLSIPDQHQQIGIEWLQAAFVIGMPGVLLADDMGLGKTFQVLAFIHWLRLNQGLDGRPVLVVAPVKLLEEWREQIEEHLPSGALGKPIYAYDRGLREIRVEKASELSIGRTTLDIDKLRHSDFVLTTYETLRDHQFSFGRVRFRLIIFDEAQKLKSGASLVNHAAKTQQPDFVVLVTGTPVENSTMDIWTLLDVAWPGFLGLSGRQFVERYGDGSDPALMESLKQRLIQSQQWKAESDSFATPPVMLRRFKSDILEGLPPKEERPWQELMPHEQVRAYDAVILAMQTARMHPLEALQQLRRICLHPNLHVPKDAADRANLIEGSARFQTLFRILRAAHAEQAGVLVFVDILKAQDVLQTMIRDEFKMPRLPQVINGQTNPRAVAAIKRGFQEGRGFDVLLLGPKAAGFGLNLTRATYVIHLNRWWNPAVEDQCSDRAHRKGQRRIVTVHLPLAVHPQLGENSFDLILHSMLTRKRALSRQIVVPSLISQQELANLIAQVASAFGSLDKDLLDALDTKDWRAFEVWVLGRFQSSGWQVYETPATGDAGADLIARHPAGGRSVVVQVKHRSMGKGRVGESAIREVAEAPQRYRPKHPWLANPILVAVTNGIFDLPARTLANQRAVRLVDRTSIISLEGFARELFKQEVGSERGEKQITKPKGIDRTDHRELNGRIERIELQLRALIGSVLNGDINRLPPHVNQKLEERLASELKKNVAVDLRKHDAMHRRLEFCDLRELADCIGNKALWPEFRVYFVNKETFADKFGQLAELRNAIRHSRTISEIVRMEGEAGILWFEHLLDQHQSL